MRCESAEASAVIAVDGAGSAVPKGMGGVGREEELILPLKYDRIPTKKHPVTFLRVIPTITCQDMSGRRFGHILNIF